MPEILSEQDGGFLVRMDDGTERVLPDVPSVRELPRAAGGPSPSPTSAVGPEMFGRLGGFDSVLPGDREPNQPLSETATDLAVRMKPARVPEGMEDSFMLKPPTSDLEAKLRTNAVSPDVVVAGFLRGMVDPAEFQRLTEEGLIPEDRAQRATEAMDFSMGVQERRKTPPKQAVFATGQPPGAPGAGSPTGPRIGRLGGRDLAKAFDQEAAAIEQGSEARQALAQAEADKYSQMADLRRQQQAEEQAMALAQDRVMQQEQAKLEDLQVQVRSMHVDPGRIWKTRGTAGQVTSAIAVGLGAIGAALAGGSNQALQMLQAAIDRDIQAQMVDIEQGREAVAGQRGIIQLVRQRYADKSQQRAAAQALAYDSALQEINAIKTKHAGAIDAAAADQMIAGVEQRKQGALLDLQKANMQIALQEASMQVQRMKAAGKMMGAVDPKLMVPGVGVALDPEAAKKVRMAKISHEKALRQIKELQGYGRSLPGSVDRKLAAQLATELKLELKNVYQLGVLSKSDERLLDQIVANPTRIFQRGATEQLAHLERGINTEWDSVTQAYMQQVITEPSEAEVLGRQ